MRRTRAMKPSARAATSPGDSPSGAAVAEQLPAGLLLQDVLGQHPLEAAVVPLDQVRIDLATAPKPASSHVLEARCNGLVKTRGERDIAAAARRSGGRAPPRPRSAGCRCGRCAGGSRSRPCRRAGRGTVSAYRMAWIPPEPAPGRARCRARPEAPLPRRCPLRWRWRPGRPPPSAPTVQPLIAGMSSPCRSMYCLCSISFSWIACLK